MTRSSLFLFFVVILAILLRFSLLGEIPIGITGDELDYVINAKAIFLTGHDISGTWNPFSLTPPPFEYPKGEIYYLLLSPFVGLAPFSLFAARTPFAIASVLFVLIIYGITRKLIGEKEAVLAALVMAINPWSIVFARTGYDSALSSFFYFAAFYVLLITRGWKILLAVPLLFCAFFGYVGTKLIFLPFLIATVFYAYYFINKKRYLKQYITVLLIGIVFIVLFLFNLSSPHANRVSDLNSPFSASMKERVMKERQQAVATPLSSVFSNKFSVYFHDIEERYSNAFSPYVLFFGGEYTSFFTLRNQGFFYAIDALLVLLGACVLFAKKREVFYLLGILCLITPLPSALSTVGTSYAIRSSVFIPLLVIVIACGISFLISNKKLGRVFVILLCLIYLGSTAKFLHNYFFMNPVYASEQVNFSGRQVAKYLTLAKEKNQDVVFLVRDSDPRTLLSSSFFKQYLFYTNGLSKDSAVDIKMSIKNQSNRFQKISLFSCSEFKDSEETLFITSDSKCKLVTKKPRLSIAQLSDAGGVYSVYDSNICNQYELRHYPQNIQLRDFQVEKMSEKEFCETFIVR